MTETDREEILAYRTALDWLYHLSQLRARAADPAVDSAETWTPSADVVSEQQSRTRAARESAMASTDDPRALWSEAVRPHTSGHVTAFLRRVSLSQTDLVCVCLPDQTRRGVLSGDRATLLTVLDQLLSVLETVGADAFVQWSGTDNGPARPEHSLATRTITVHRTDAGVEARGLDAEGETVVERWPLCGDR
jgi:hypothetical protein